MHGHSPRSAGIIGVAGLLLAAAILLFVPSVRTTKLVGAAFVALFALKHLALAWTVGAPTLALVRRLRRRPPSLPSAPPRPGADGFYRTGDVEPHRGILRLAHEVRVLPRVRSRQALLELDADKRMSLQALRELPGDRARRTLGERYAKRGFTDAARVERFLAPLHGPIAKGSSIVFAYDSATQTTHLTVGDAHTSETGLDFMRATWALWFGPTAPAATAEELMRHLPETAEAVDASG
jgi:hypothetical protein